MSEKRYIIVLSTANTLEEAKEISRGLVKNSLAACVNIIKNESSIYRWKDEICEESEYQLIIKTQKTLFEKVKSAIENMHSYEVPEVIAIDIASGNADYLKWIDDSTC